MTLTNVLIGLAIGLPVMIAVGPISILLLDQGLERGVRTAAPAVIGVASADLTLSVVASIGGASVTRVLDPVTPALTAVAVVVLLALAVDLGRTAMRELSLPARGTRVLVGAGAESSVVDEVVPADAPEPVDEARSRSLQSLTGARLAGSFYGLTLVNPLTLVLFASLVIAGGNGIGTPGWAIGMAIASFLAHGAYLVAGGLLGGRLSTTASGWLRVGAAAFMAGLAVHFAL